MRTADVLLRACDRAMLSEIRSGRADPRVRDAFRRQLVAGMGERIVGDSVSRQTDFTVDRLVEPDGQELLF